MTEQRHLTNSQIDRELELAEAEQRVALPGWRDVLTGLFRGEADRLSTDEKTAIVGAPGRRSILRIGGLSVAGAALIAACGGDGPDGPNNADGGNAAGGVGAPGQTPSDGVEQSASGPSDMDLVLLRTATSLELAAVDTYQAAIDAAGDLGIGDVVAQAATLFQAHHAEHAAALQGGTEAAGGVPFVEANSFFMDNVITPALGGLTDEISVVELALSLEIAASQTYTFAGSALSMPSLRQTIMSIGGVEERHAAVLRGVLGQSQVPNVFNPTSDAAPQESFVSIS